MSNVLPPVNNDNEPNKHGVFLKKKPHLAQFVPISRYLIDKYNSDISVLGIDAFDYAFLEDAICWWLYQKDKNSLDRKLKFNCIANWLCINPIKLYNDQSFSEMYEAIISSL